MTTKRFIITGNAWIVDELPDSEMTVLIRQGHADEEYPIWIGYHDGENWCDVHGATIEFSITGWMELEDALTFLDQAKKSK